MPLIVHLTSLLLQTLLFCPETDAEITWTTPPPQRGPLEISDGTVRETTQRLINGSSEEQLKWEFTLSNEILDEVSWQINGVRIGRKEASGRITIHPTSNFREHFGISATDQATLIIYNVTEADNAVFSCVVRTRTKDWFDRIQVKVGVPPKLIKVSQNQTVREGSDLQLLCEASGKPTPNITWTIVFRNGSESEVLHRGSTWNMVNIKRTNQGTYRCTAYNGAGNADRFVVIINITYPATIIKRQNSTVQVGGYAALICLSEGNPTPVISWTRGKTDEVVGYGSTLVVCSAQFYNSGWYTCSSANILGKDRASVYLEVTEKRSTLLNITMIISNEEYHEDLERLGSERSKSLVSRLKEAVKAVFQGDSSFENADVVGFRPGSIIVSFVLTFKEPVTEEHVMSTLKTAAESGNLGAFKVNGSSIVATQEYGFQKTPATTKSTPVQVCNGCSCSYIIFVAVVVILVTVIIVLLIYVVWLHRRVARIKERAHQESSDEKITVQMAKLELNLKETRQQESQGSSRGQYMDLDDTRRSHDILGASQQTTPQISQYAPLHPSTLSWEIPRQHVKIEKVIGKGSFGQVAKGTAVGLRGMREETLVAVKMLKADAPESDKKDLLSELEVMKTLKPHPHVIKLLGCVTESEPLLVLIEYVPYGDLLGYLRKSRGLNDTYYKDPDIKPQTSLTSEQLIKFAWQVADGMSYLSSRSIIHRDLAARNVLIGERETCKVTDFGMARDVQQENIYERKTKGRLPVKWTAYESLLYGKYTTKSDIWSYGVLLYEIFTIGGSPYPRMDGRKIASFLQQGYRMPKPQHVDDELYKIMMMCWEEEPDARPTFVDLRNKLKKMDKQNKKYINMNMYDTKLYANVEDLVV